MKVDMAYTLRGNKHTSGSHSNDNSSIIYKTVYMKTNDPTAPIQQSDYPERQKGRNEAMIM